MRPKRVACESPEDRLPCNQRESCDKFELYEDEVEEFEANLEDEDDGDEEKQE